MRARRPDRPPRGRGRAALAILVCGAVIGATSARSAEDEPAGKVALAARRSRAGEDFVISGGLAPARCPGPGCRALAIRPTDVVAVSRSGVWTAAGKNDLLLTDDSTCWVIADGNRVERLGPYARHGPFAVACSASEPPVPRGAVPLMKVTTASGTVSAIADRRPMLQLPDGSVHADDLGADPTGGSDSSRAINLALELFDTNASYAGDSGTGGVARIGPGVYRVDETVEIPSLVSLVGAGQTLLRAGAKDLGSVVNVPSIGVHSGNRSGELRGIAVDCARKARVGLELNESVQRHYENLTIRGCVDVGILIRTAQNNTFVSVDSERNGSTNRNDCIDAGLRRFACSGGIRIENGAGNNVFLRSELSDNVPYELVITDNGRDPKGFPAGPSGNSFVGSIFERPMPGMQALVYIRAGRFNKFLDSSFSATHVEGSFTGVLLTTEDRDAGCVTCETRHNRFLGADYSGTPAHSTAFEARASARMRGGVLAQVDGIFMENHLVGFRVDANARINVGPSMDYNHVAKVAEPDEASVGLTAGDFRFRARYRRPREGDVALGVGVEGDQRDRFAVESGGALKWSDGKSTGDAALSRVELPNGAAALATSTPLLIESGAGIYSGKGSPEGAVSAVQGSVYLRTDGEPGATIYVKERGAAATGWVAK